MSESGSRQITYYGIVLSYVRSRARQYNKYLLVKVLDTTLHVDNLIGFKVVIRDSNSNNYLGKIIRVHGKGVNNTVVVRMRNSIPGQLLGSQALILPS